jgi:hypothetical protein
MADFQPNALNQALDIKGSETHNSSMSLPDEALGRGVCVGQFGTTASIVVGANIVVSGLVGMSADSVGRYLTISGATNAGNNGSFFITDFNNVNSVNISNSSASTDPNNGAISWAERNPYSLEDDLNFERTDRQAIKGVPYTDPIPTYKKVTDESTFIPANLANIAGKTTDAKAIIVNKRFDGVAVSAGINFVKITGTFPYANAVNTTGIPINDGFDSANADATYVGIIDSTSESALYVTSGAHAGERIYGRTRKGASGVDGVSVEIEFRSVVKNANISTSVVYTWEGTQPTLLHLFYSYRYGVDQVPDTSFKDIIVDGVIEESNNANVNFNRMLLWEDGSLVYIGDGDISLRI